MQHAAQGRHSPPERSVVLQIAVQLVTYVCWMSCASGTADPAVVCNVWLCAQDLAHDSLAFS